MSTSTMHLQLSIWAEDLPSVSTFGTPSPFAVVTVLHKEEGVKPTILGKTEVIDKTNSPDWTKILLLQDFELGKQTHLVVSIYDATNGKNHPMGSTILEVGSVLGAKGHIVAKELKAGGILVAHVEESTGSGMLHFRLRGFKFTNTEGMGFLNKSDPFFELQRLRKSTKSGARVWDCVFRSNAVQDNLSPVWSESYLELAVLCGGNRQQKCRLAVYDYDKNGKHDPMGDVQFTVDELLESVTESALSDIPKINTDKAFTLKRAGAEVGKILVVSAEVVGVEEPSPEVVEAEAKSVAVVAEEEIDIVISPDEDIEVEPDELERLEPRFVNYIGGGCKIHVMTAIDATASNGDPRQPTSLHYFKKDGRNDYEDALVSICTILSNYDSDQRYPVFGFGAKVNGSLSHCFQLGATAEVDGVEGISKAYSDAFKAGITMSSPRDVSAVIDMAAKDSIVQLGKEQVYTVLLIFLSGDPADSEQTLVALKAADDAALSVVVVGVGEDDFKGLKDLLLRHKTSGCRDNVRFVNYQALKGDQDKLTEAALDSIPNQLVTYFVGKGIDPLPEAEPDDVVVQPYIEDQDVAVPIQFTAAGDPVVAGDARPPSNDKPDYANQIKQGIQMVSKKMGRRKVGQLRRRIRQEAKKISKKTFGASPF